MTTPSTEQPPARAIDRPSVPRSKVSLLIKIYGALSVAVLAGFILAGVMGWEVTDSTTDRGPGSARRSPGGHVYFWHVGYHGGK